MKEIITQTQKQTKIYNRLYELGKSFNESLEIDNLYEMALNFSKDDLNYEKCLIFENNSENGWFKVVKSIGYDNPMEKSILKIINLLLSGEVIEYLRVTGEPIVHSEANPDAKVSALVKSLFMEEAYFELFGGDVENPYGLIVVGNSTSSKEKHTSLEEDSMTKLALGNFIMQFSNTINNIIFFEAWNNEKKVLEENIIKRTKELTQQKNTFEAIYNTSKDGIAILDVETTAFLDANQAYADMTGFSKEELLRTSCLKLSFDKDIEKSKKAMQEVLKNGFITNFEKDCRTKDGEPITINMSVTLMLGGTKVLVSAKDVTEQKKLEKNLLEQTKKSQLATKAKSEFLANMSHEIRTPMNGIIGMSHLVLQTDLDDKQKNYLHKIDNSAKSLLGIINDILDFSKIEAGKLEIEKVEFDLFKVIDSIIGLIEFRAHEKNLEIIVSYGSNVGKSFYGDPLRVGQVLTNLMSNAVKFTHSGEIGIYIHKLNEDRFRFEVKDTGVGLTPQQQSKLFQSFSQADGSTTREYGGTGLGLSISKQLVELMNGKLWVESQKGEGSNFIFEIELTEYKVNNKIYNQFNDKKVLIVDDNESWHEVLENLLTNFGMAVDVVHSGYKALDILQGCRNRYDLILMDWNMPHLDGIETTKLINKSCVMTSKKPPTVIMVSAFRQESIVKLAKDVGIEIFLQKPINPSILNDILSGLFLEDIEIVYANSFEEHSIKYDINTLDGSKILLVEDNLINQEIILGLLENSGIQVDVANNGVEAVEKFQQSQYELILMDLQMPIMDGYGATQKIREINQQIPIIALTANAMREDVERTQKAGMNEHLNKPIDVEKLYETLLKYISKKTDIATTENTQKEQIEIPKFESIDTELGLFHLAGNKKLYLKILRDFYTNYKNLNLETLDEDEYKRILHTIKGLSANIGAKDLHKITTELEKSKEEVLLVDFYEALRRVLNELKVLEIQDKKEKKDTVQITDSLSDKLFLELKEAVKTKQPKKCQVVIEKIHKHNLSAKDEELFSVIISLIKKYKFKETLELL